MGSQSGYFVIMRFSAFAVSLLCMATLGHSGQVVWEEERSVASEVACLGFMLTQLFNVGPQEGLLGRGLDAATALTCIKSLVDRAIDLANSLGKGKEHGKGGKEHGKGGKGGKEHGKGGKGHGKGGKGGKGHGKGGKEHGKGGKGGIY